MKTRLVLLPLVAAVLAAMAWAAPAYATAYASKSSPIKAESNTDDGNAWFYGAITVKQQTSLYNKYQYRDSAPGGNYAYAQTDWYYWVECTGGESCYDSSGSDQSRRDRSGDWTAGVDADILDSNADKGRGVTKVCEDQSWSPDACSKKVIVTLSY